MFIYALYSDIKYHDTINYGIESKKTVVAQNCRYSRRAASGVTINDGKRDYFVKLSNKTCSKFPVNTIIPVFYSKEYDEYIYEIKNYQYTKTKLCLILILISLLPWTLFYQKLVYRKIKGKKEYS